MFVYSLRQENSNKILPLMNKVFLRMSAEDLTTTSTPTTTVHQLNSNHSSTTATLPQYSVPAPQLAGTSKYSQLLSVIEELSKDIRPTYTGRLILPQRPAALACYSSENMFVVSTYQLNGQSTSREGALYIIKDFVISETVPMSGGVFRFEFDNSSEHIYTALTNGSLGVVDLRTLSVSDLPVVEGSMLLSVSIRNGTAVTSDNHGSIHVVDIVSGQTKSFRAHTLPYTGEGCEVWSVAWLDENLLVSGGEDGIMKMWDLRIAEKAVMVCREHSSGIVCLKTEDETSLLSGCYDELIRRFDKRSIARPVNEKNVRYCLYSIFVHGGVYAHCFQLGGGVWAIESDKESDNLLVACMYNGWCLIDAGTFEECESNHQLGSNLLYGASLCKKSRVVASCTFNDYVLSFEKINDF
ncbi:unnamed protein product [Anisakis simplex]|uniref:methylated diphthine methylhydrolase n=1 Tax=Anisakis simplex TaxID=6269 RepID=A0A3P6QIG7_ANISI|nr:unnamed protein product [Anisakis simplex]